ncbi:MAG: hypothetical protein AAGL24_27880 [Pseudomonadota bacterium]
MKRLLLAATLLFAIPGLAPAETVTLAYQAVMHVREANAITILDDESHQIGIARFRGLALLQDGTVVPHRYEGWFDLTSGSGPFHGYALWTFPDGSTLRARYDGTATAGADGAVTVEAILGDISGSGRFETVAGEGSFSGRRVDAIADGGNTHVIGRLVLRRP